MLLGVGAYCGPGDNSLPGDDKAQSGFVKRLVGQQDNALKPGLAQNPEEAEQGSLWRRLTKGTIYNVKRHGYNVFVLSLSALLVGGLGMIAYESQTSYHGYVPW